MKGKGIKGGTMMSGGTKPSVAPPPLVGGVPKVAAAAKATKAAYKDGGVVEGKKAAMRLDRPGRKTGGRVGADCAPLSSAANTTN